MLDDRELLAPSQEPKNGSDYENRLPLNPFRALARTAARDIETLFGSELGLMTSDEARALFHRTKFLYFPGQSILEIMNRGDRDVVKQRHIHNLFLFL